MNTLIVLIVVAALIYGLARLLRPQPVETGGVLLVSGGSSRFSHIKVLGGLVLGALAWAAYIGLTSLYLATRPQFLSEWWMLVGLADLFAFALCVMPCIPKAYREYMDRKPKGAHAAFDYFVGLVMSLILLPGLAFHMAVLSFSPHFAL